MTREDAIERIKAMQRTPGMWALTVEGFLLQVAVLLEVCGVDRDGLWVWMQTLDSDHRWTDAIDAELAERICTTALKLTT